MKQLTSVFEALITTRPPSDVFDLASFISALSSIFISFWHRRIFDVRSTFTSSLETVSRFFSKKPCDSYCTVSEKCLTLKATVTK